MFSLLRKFLHITVHLRNIVSGRIKGTDSTVYTQNACSVYFIQAMWSTRPRLTSG